MNCGRYDSLAIAKKKNDITIIFELTVKGSGMLHSIELNTENPKYYALLNYCCGRTYNIVQKPLHSIENEHIF